MNVSQNSTRTRSESGCRSGRTAATAPADTSLVIENLNEFGAAGQAGICYCIADFIIRESRPAAA